MRYFAVFLILLALTPFGCQHPPETNPAAALPSPPRTSAIVQTSPPADLEAIVKVIKDNNKSVIQMKTETAGLEGQLQQKREDIHFIQEIKGASAAAAAMRDPEIARMQKRLDQLNNKCAQLAERTNAKIALFNKHPQSTQFYVMARGANGTYSPIRK